MANIGTRIREAREAVGLTQRRTADLLDVTEGTVQAWEYERANLTLQRAAQLAELYSVSIDWIAYGHDETVHEQPLLKDLRKVIERYS